MRILITGVTGQVGSALVDRLGGFASLIRTDRGGLDLSKPHDIKPRLEELKPDVIINPAAYTAVDRAEDERDLAFLVNAAGPEAIARWAAAADVPLVHFSTDYVFDGSGDRPWREEDPTGPLNVYGASKLAGEQAVSSAGGPHLIVRTSWVYAATGNNFLRTMVQLARERPELRIVADQIGSPTSAAVIADAITRIIRRHHSDLPSAFSASKNLVHLSAAGQTSWHGFAQAIIEGVRQRGLPVTTRTITPIATKDYPTKATRPRNSRLNLQRLEAAFGITPPLWNDALETELDRLAMRPGAP